MSVENSILIPELSNHATVDLGMHVTAMDHLPRLGTKLGINLLAKRDDTATLAMGGNKVRQLEYYLGPASQMDADTILITGALQSNFTRLCAAATRKLGWHPIVQLEDRVPRNDAAYKSSGNVLLNQLLGAEIHYFPDGDNEAAADANLDQIAQSLQSRGRNPYVIHLGINHPPLGGLGYVRCAMECYSQLNQLQQPPDHIVIPSGSGLTHAGFLAGIKILGWDVQIHGVCVRREAHLQHERILNRATEICALLDRQIDFGNSEVRVDDSVLSPGYGRMNAQIMAVMSEAAQLEALILDPVYSGRTMAGLVSLVERGAIQKSETVLFVHTGGYPAIFAYEKDLINNLKSGTQE